MLRGCRPGPRVGRTPPPRLFLLCLLFAPTVWAKDTLTIGITQFPATLHPAIDTMLAKSYVLGFVRRPLTAYDEHWQLVCLLCEQLPSFENGLARHEGKGIAMTIRIREGASWGDGVPVSSDDVVLGWEVGKHPQSGVASAESYRRITAIDVVDQRSFVLHMDRVSFDYNSLGEFKLLPAHIERARFEADPARYHDTTAYDRDPGLPGLWNGPYRVVKIEPGQSVEMERNPYWPGSAAAFAHLTVRVVENSAALEATLLSGGVDMVAGELGLPLEQALAFERRHGDRFRVVSTPSLVYEHIDLNLNDPLLADPRIRQALSLGIDRDAICRYLFQGHQQAAAGFVPPLDPAYDRALPPLDYDPQRAALLLEQAGFILKDGIRTNTSGQALRFELMTTAGNRQRQLVAEVLQAQWRQLGIQVTLKLEPARVFFGQTLTKRRFAHMAMFAWFSAPESVPRSILHSHSIPNADNGWAGENYTSYINPGMDQLIDRIETQPDFAARQPLWQRMQSLYQQDLPALPLFFKSDAHIWPRQLQGITPTGHEDQTPLWVENWRWSEP